jgi:hypothetical protein
MSNVRLQDVIESIKNNEFGKDLKKGEELFILYQTPDEDGGVWQHGYIGGSRERLCVAFATRMMQDEDFRSLILDAMDGFIHFMESKMRTNKNI